jgi:hypothetical protein
MASYRFSAEQKQCWLSTPFGADYACKVFGLTPAELEALVGRYVRGKRKGELRGSIAWSKITRGGWVKTGAYDFDENRACGFVVRPGLTYGHALFNGAGEQVKGPGPRVDDATLIQAELRRRGEMKPAPAPVAQPSPVHGEDLPWTAPYLHIGLEEVASQCFEAARHGGNAFERFSLFSPQS